MNQPFLWNSRELLDVLSAKQNAKFPKRSFIKLSRSKLSIFVFQRSTFVGAICYPLRAFQATFGAHANILNLFTLPCWSFIQKYEMPLSKVLFGAKSMSRYEKVVVL